MKKRKLTPEERKALNELFTQQTTRLGYFKSQRKTLQDTPLFNPNNQTELF